MAERIAYHRLARDPMWETIEEPLRVAERLRAVRAGVVVVDCLTLWLANAMEADLDIGRAVAELLEALLGRMAAVVAVSNEVGLGVVPASPLGRRFRDEAGSMNQRIAAAADEVYFLVAGQVLRLR
jgi:adenosyl cobinamide kinase/adenosyl cobinamide phosphate guanylyltransferase